MMPSLKLKRGFKIVSLSTIYGSLEDPRLNGYKYAIMDYMYRNLGSAKKYLQLKGKSVLKFETRPNFNVDHDVVFMETYDEIYGYDDGVPEPMDTYVYIIKNNIMKNVGEKTKKYPTVVVERNGKQEFGTYVAINGPCNMIYDLENYHELGGKVRIETNSEIEFLKWST
jgi:hypothetical protein